MMLPPRQRSILENPATWCELTLLAIRRRQRLLELAAQNPLAWCALELLALALGLEGPGEEQRRLWLAEALTEAALSWLHSRQPRRLA